MPEYQGPDSMAAEIADLKRRLHVLETAPQSNRTDLQNGSFVIRSSADPEVLVSMDVDTDFNDAGFRAFTADGDQSVYMGTGSNGLDGLLDVRNRDGRTVLYVLSASGVYRPVIPCPWVKNPAVAIDSTTGSARTASGSYDTMYRTYMNCQTHIYHRWFIDLQAGVTAVAFKLTGQDTFNGGVETTIYEQTGITVDTSLDVNTAIPSLAADGLSVVGEFLELRAYLRITGGAGNATLAPVWPAIPSQS